MAGDAATNYATASRLFSIAISGGGDTTPPSQISLVNDGVGPDIVYTKSTTTLSAHWSSSTDVESGVSNYWYAIGTTPGATDVVPFTDAATATSFSRNGLTLTEGATYYTTVQPQNGAGLFATPTASNGITVDYTPPVVQINNPPASATMSTSFMTDVSDVDSITVSCSSCEYMVESYDGASWVTTKAWALRGCNSAASAPVTVGDGMDCRNVGTDKCRVTVRSTDLANNTASDVVRLFSISYGGATDTTPPSQISSVYDGLGADIAYSTSSTVLSANWTPAADMESGILRYWYAIGTTPGGTNVINWTDNATSTNFTRTGAFNDSMYYVSVRPENGAGLFATPTVSNGLVIDALPPVLAISYPLNNADVGGNIIIMGTVMDSALVGWSLSFAPQDAINPVWVGIASGSMPFSSTTIATWNATQLNGLYTLKLEAGDMNGRTSQLTVNVSVGSSVSVSGIVPRFKWIMMSVPADPVPSAPSAMFGQGEYKVYRWDPTASDDLYVSKYRSPLALAPGFGFWIKSYYNDLTYAYNGKPVPTTQEFAVGLRTGWNQIGVPLMKDYSWSTVKVRDGANVYSMADAVSLNLINGMLMWYDSEARSWRQGDPATVIRPQVGYEVMAYKDIELLFDPNGGAGGGLTRMVRRPFDFRIKISASTPGSADIDNFFGAAADASEGFDTVYDLDEPNIAPGDSYVSLYFTGSNQASRLANDIRSAAAVQSTAAQQNWQFNVATNDTGETMTLNWDSQSLPSGYQFTLVDLETGTRIDMSAIDSYSYVVTGAQTASGPRFRIEVVKIAAGAVTKNFTLKSGWNLISAPMEPAITSALSLLGKYLPMLNVYQLTGGKAYVAESADIQAGLGYWVYVAADTEISISGVQVTSATTVPLSAGWNLIGNPFSSEIAWADNIKFVCDRNNYALSQAIAAGLTDGKIFEFTGAGYAPASVMEPWKGYIVKSASSCDLEISN